MLVSIYYNSCNITARREMLLWGGLHRLWNLRILADVTPVNRATPPAPALLRLHQHGFKAISTRNHLPSMIPSACILDFSRSSVLIVAMVLCESWSEVVECVTDSTLWGLSRLELKALEWSSGEGLQRLTRASRPFPFFPSCRYPFSSSYYFL